MDYTVERNLESVLIKVNKFINIDKERERYAKNFEAVRDALFTKLRKYQPFGSLFNGYQIGGSYGDNLKVSIPNEFDVVFRIKFPEYKLIDVSEDYDHPGNVHLNFSRVLMKIRKETQHETTYTFLIRKLLDDDNYLLVERLQSYIQSCFVKALDAMDQRYDSFTLEYSRQGPAHTITVDGRNFTYSIDFVPGILLEESQSIVPSHVGQWEAIPKPIWGVRNSTSFRSSFYMQEKKLIDSNYNLKNALRMMKKFRDVHSNMHNMKSYFIKTLFMWKAKEEDSSYWYKSLSKIIIDMFEIMEDSLIVEELPFFWDKRLNMYDKFSSIQLREMLVCVTNCRRTLQMASNGMTLPLQKRVYSIFTLKLERNPYVSQESYSEEIYQPLIEDKCCIIL